MYIIIYLLLLITITITCYHIKNTTLKHTTILIITVNK